MRAERVTIDASGVLVIHGAGRGVRLSANAKFAAAEGGDAVLDDLAGPAKVIQSGGTVHPYAWARSIQINGLMPGAISYVVAETHEELQALGDIPGRQPLRVAVFKGVGLTNDAPGTIAAAAFAVPDSWVGGKLHFICHDGADHHFVKWVKDAAGIYRPAGTIDVVGGVDQTAELDVSEALDGIYIQADAAGPVVCDLFVEVP